MEAGEEIIVELDQGKTRLIEFLSYVEADQEGMAKVFFKVNGQTRAVDIRDEAVKVEKVVHQKADKTDKLQIGAPLQGSLSGILVKEGDEVEKNQPLFTIEAMKMETTITASAAGKVDRIVLKEGEMVFADDLVLTIK